MRALLPLLAGCLAVAGCEQLLPFSTRVVVSDAAGLAADAPRDAAADAPAADASGDDASGDDAPVVRDLSVEDLSLDGAVGCSPPAGALASEGFEGPFPPPSVSISSSTTGSVDRVTSAQCGVAAMRARVVPPAPAEAGAFANWYPPVAGEGDARYIRGWFFVPGGFTVPPGGWLILIRANAVGARGQKLSADLHDGDALAVINNVVDPAKWARSAAGAMPRDVWVCLELGAGVSDAGGWVRLWRDGVEVPGTALAGLDTLPPAGIGEVGLGIVHVGSLVSAAAYEVLVDEVVIAKSRIGCD